MDISIVLPTYNERDNISPLIERTLTALSDYELEIVVVDDDSPDGTWQIVAEKGETDPRLLVDNCRLFKIMRKTIKMERL